MGDLFTLFIFFLGFICFVLVAMVASSGGPQFRRQRTQREDDLHDQIQQAMNWKPGFPPRDATFDENNEWKDPDSGKVWKRMTLNELFDAHKKDS